MRSTFTLTEKDFFALLKIINRRLTTLSKANTKLFIANLLTWIPLGIAFGTFISLYRKHSYLAQEFMVIAAFLGIGAILIIATAFYKQRVYRRVLLSEHGLFLSEQIVELTADGFTIENRHGKTNLAWSSVIHHAEDSSNLYLFIDNSQAFVLPKSVLNSLEQIKKHLMGNLNDARLY